MDAEPTDATVEDIERLYRSRYQRFLRLALAVVGSREAAADVVQEAFARALRSRADFRAQGSLESWVWRIVMNVARTRRQAPPQLLGQPADADAADGQPSTWPELRAAVAALPERQRQALFLRHYADLSYEEIGDILGMARGTVSATLHAAHGSLRRTLEAVTT